ncbi:MAG: B12-binding domain-containing radical SAM protein [bacterium]|nr:B12-binding domain-containing radical SAM protein [bacterium]
MRNALLVNPVFPPSYWSYSYALEFVGKKASIPPLGLLTVASMFPDDWSLRLVDMNVRPLHDEDLAWADAVFTSSMIVQRDSLFDVVQRCRRAGVPVVAGGPHPTAHHAGIQAEFEPGEGVDHFVLGEVEAIFPAFLEDLRKGIAKPLYGPAEKPEVATTPVPRFDLIDPDDYGSMALQYSRGCPFDCEFCDITALYGRRPRTKSPEQMVVELEAVYRTGWRGSLFLVDDNFIGNKRNALQLLEAVKKWQEAHGYPFSFMTEASVNLAKIPELLRAMQESGFTMVFLGIESPGEAALEKTSKGQNLGQGEEAGSFLQRAVHTLQAHGMEVSSLASMATRSSIPTCASPARRGFRWRWQVCSRHSKAPGCTRGWLARGGFGRPPPAATPRSI